MAPDPFDSPPPPATSSTSTAVPRRRRRWRGTAIALLALAALLAAAWYLVNRPPADEPGAAGRPGGARGPGAAGRPAGPGGGRPLATVGMAVAGKADVPVLIEALGTVTPVTTVTLRPQVSGVLTDVLFTEGQTVRKGELLARIDPRPFQQALMQAQGTRVRDEAQLRGRARDAAALPHAARAGLDRPAGGRHPGRAGAAARRHGDHRPAPPKAAPGSTSTTRASRRR